MKRFVIIESGSTKADWAFVINNEVTKFETEGINLSTGAGMEQRLNNEIISLLNLVDKIFFYGAGANVPMAKLQFSNFISQYIKEHAIIAIESDMLAAARACAIDESAIICILGTGSNSCVYDGEKITDQIVSLGYLLSDEGSGNHIGKEVIKAYFYGEMEMADKVLFNEMFKVDRNSLLQSIYVDKRVSAFLATFALFLNKCSQELRNRILEKVFDEFVEIRIKKYTNYSKFDIHFVGSIASAFETELKKVLEKNDLIIKSVVKSPIQNLIKYHISREENQT